MTLEVLLVHLLFLLLLVLFDFIPILASPTTLASPLQRLPHLLPLFNFFFLILFCWAAG